MKCKAQVILISKTGTDEIECLGTYYGTGRLICWIGEAKLRVDPADYHPKDPKRLYNCTTKKWTRFRVQSILLDPRAIKKTV